MNRMIRNSVFASDYSPLQRRLGKKLQAQSPLTASMAT